MYLLFLILPLYNSLSFSFNNFFFNKNILKTYIILYTIFNFILLIISFYEIIILQNNCYINLGLWVNFTELSLNWTFLYDYLTIFMFIIINIISNLVHIYSLNYMEQDPHLNRFLSFLSLFTFFMIILVSSNNFLQMFLGWEGVGLCSYLLINFWFTRIQANKAALKAMFMNRIGDFFLFLGILLIFYFSNSLLYSTFFLLIPYLEDYSLNLMLPFNSLEIISILIFMGAVGKSAQFGLHTWLPDAMEGPTPVSALIHAATMVTAGVFLIIKCSYLYEYTIYAKQLLIIIGSITCFFAATIGLVQNDLKKIIAYSTCSQLGYMVFACGLGAYSGAFFHLINHAFFKALLFLGAGVVIHALNDEQDIRKMGGLKKLLPLTYSLFLIASLSLAGFPFLSGFFSKEYILENSLFLQSNASLFSYILGVIASFCTAFYSFRLLLFVFLKKTNGFRINIINAHEGSLYLLIPLLILVIPSIFSGYFFKIFFISLGSQFSQASIFYNNYTSVLADFEFLQWYKKLIPIIISLLGIITSYYIIGLKYNTLTTILLKKPLLTKIYLFLNKKWYIDKIYNYYIGYWLYTVSLDYFYNLIDRGLLEFLGPSGLKKIFFTEFINKFITNFILQHFIIILLSLIFIMSF